jgi:uncharacterized membrane protein YkoI
MNKAFLLFVLPVAMAYAASSYAGKEEKVEWSRVPLAVQKTITENARGGKIDEIEKEMETHNGKTITVYEADVRKPDGNKFEIKVAEHGKLIKIDD